MRSKASAAVDMEWYRYKGDLRTIDGKLPRGCPWNRHWSIDQGEPHYPFGEWGYGSRNLSGWVDYTVTIIPLNNGKFIARPIYGDVLFDVNSPQFDTREQALRAAVAQVIRLVRRHARMSKSIARYGWLRPELARDLIAWAMSLVGRPPPPLYVAPLPEAIVAPLARGDGQLILF